jgi:thioredoxin 1
MSEIIINEQNFDSEVLNSPIPVLIDFWAPWCGPCKMIAPVIEELANEYAGKIKVGKLNTDENIGIASRYQISSIPTLMFFKDTKPVHKIVGFKSKTELKKFIDGFLSA